MAWTMNCLQLNSCSFFRYHRALNSDNLLQSASSKHLLQISVPIYPKKSKKNNISINPNSNDFAYARTSEPQFTYNVEDDLRQMCENGNLSDAVAYFELIHQGGLRIAPKNYALLLQECAKEKNAIEGKRIHALLATSETKMDVFLKNNLLSMYVKCGCLYEARNVFEAMRTSKDVVSWTLMINAYAEHGHLKEAMKLFFTMNKRHVKPNKITYICLLKACNAPEFLDEGKRIHEHIIKRCLEHEKYVGTALVRMYIKCGSITCARRVFNGVSQKDGFLWNIMIEGYARYELHREVLKNLHHMRWRYTIEPTEATWVFALQACANLFDLAQGKLLHACICESELLERDSIGSALVNMYIKCKSIADARCVFDHLFPKLLPSCNSLIEAYNETGEHDEASKLACRLQKLSMVPVGEEQHVESRQ